MDIKKELNFQLRDQERYFQFKFAGMVTVFGEVTPIDNPMDDF